MRISLLLVNWHSAEHAVRAIDSARAASVEPLEVVVIDNSVDQQEAGRVRALPADRVVVADSNLGFGAGMNRAAEASSAERIVMANPDVIFRPSAIDLLMRTLESGAAVAGPRFVWDDDARWMLPPADPHTMTSVLSQAISSRSRRLWEPYVRARTQRRVRFWSETGASSTDALSGAVLAMRRSTFESAGGFDERFHLYFEETDLLRRIARKGGRVVHEASSIVRHLYNQSGRRNPERDEIYSRSEMMFHRKWYRTDAHLRLRRPVAVPAAGKSGPEVTCEGAAWLEASPDPHFLTAAGCRVESGKASLPPEVIESLHGGRLWLRAIRADSSELARWEL